MDKIIKNYEEVLDKPLSTRLFLKFLKHKFYVNLKGKINRKKRQTPEEHIHNEAPKGIEVVSFAILVDNVVVDIMHVQKEFGEILEKNPKFISIEKDAQVIHPGFVYKDGRFMAMQDVLAETHLTMRG